jgi:hypothetical protein
MVFYTIQYQAIYVIEDNDKRVNEKKAERSYIVRRRMPHQHLMTR